jgi:hypothetical protein
VISARVERDSLSPAGTRLTTLVVTFPRFLLAEVNTHRAFSRNSASSRAIKAQALRASVLEAPFVPELWTGERKGMSGEPWDDSHPKSELAKSIWLKARDEAVRAHRDLTLLGVHKSLANRLLEPFVKHTAILSSTGWGNFLEQRDHPSAQPEFQVLARSIRDALEGSKPTLLKQNQWHLPFTDENDADLGLKDLKKLSAARCARVSYLTHDGKRDHEADLSLYERLRHANPPHYSPFEHQAAALVTPKRLVASGNFDSGWVQHRKILEVEDASGRKSP